MILPAVISKQKRRCGGKINKKKKEWRSAEEQIKLFSRFALVGSKVQSRFTFQVAALRRKYANVRVNQL